MSEQEDLLEMDRLKRADIVVRMARRIAELEIRLAKLEGKPVTGCKTCRTVAMLERFQPAGPRETIRYACPDCKQQYALAPKAEGEP